MRTVRRVGLVSERWNKEAVNGMRGTPWEPIPGRVGIEVKASVHFKEDKDELKGAQEGGRRPIIRRRVKITKGEVERMGMTPGCVGCRAANRGEAALRHSDECRKEWRRT